MYYCHHYNYMSMPAPVHVLHFQCSCLGNNCELDQCVYDI